MDDGGKDIDACLSSFFLLFLSLPCSSLCSFLRDNRFLNSKIIFA